MEAQDPASRQIPAVESVWRAGSCGRVLASLREGQPVALRNCPALELLPVRQNTSHARALSHSLHAEEQNLARVQSPRVRWIGQYRACFPDQAASNQQPSTPPKSPTSAVLFGR